MSGREGEIVLRVRRCAAKTFRRPLEEVPADLAYGSIPEWDSIGHMDFLVALEAEFAFALDSPLLLELVSVPAIASFLVARSGP